MVELICVVCALKSDASASAGVFQFDETNPLAARTCPLCSSSATVALEIFKRFALSRADTTKAKPSPVGAPNKLNAERWPLPPVGEKEPIRSSDVVARHIAETDARATSKILNESHKWQSHVDAVRSLLRRGTPDCVNADVWWDGFHFYMLHSWSIEAGSHTPDTLDYVTIRLCSKDKGYKDVTFYINAEDEGFTEVGEITK